MASKNQFSINPGWKILFREMGLPVKATLRRAGVSASLFDNLPAMLNADAYFALWDAMQVESGNDEIPLLMADALHVEVFSPPLFAAVCSPNLRQAVKRVSRYKALTGVILIAVEETGDELNINWEWPVDINPPLPLLLCELVFWAFIARTCTRLNVNAKGIELPALPNDLGRYCEYFGAPITNGNRLAMTFRSSDAELPFLTGNDTIWDAFKPGLSARLQERRISLSFVEQARDILIKAIPADCANADHVSSALSLTPRTLQRKLQNEGTSFKALLNETRKELAQHYLSHSDLPLSEISYLLGYHDPSSFNRAFREWVGITPDRYRQTHNPG